MQLTIQAIYEEGVLRLAQPIELPNGTQVFVVIMTDATVPASLAAEVLAKISSLPLASSEQKFSNRNHDEELYSAEANP
ncbi:MAG: antitoxin family protein [Leptolyngbyaceae cyanobacterium SM1_4_3]|nr:antitoxin family protein [Leptolyngbyaceae cyanobacterium SM1_4_3]